MTTIFIVVHNAIYNLIIVCLEKYMEVVGSLFANSYNTTEESVMDKVVSNLAEGIIGEDYIIKSVNTDGDSEMKNFLFSLGCYEGQKITVISKLHKNYVIVIKDAKYSIDEELARAILV